MFSGPAESAELSNATKRRLFSLTAKSTAAIHNLYYAPGRLDTSAGFMTAQTSRKPINSGPGVGSSDKVGLKDAATNKWGRSQIKFFFVFLDGCSFPFRVSGKLRTEKRNSSF